jgi:hypothetical protein
MTGTRRSLSPAQRENPLVGRTAGLLAAILSLAGCGGHGAGTADGGAATAATADAPSVQDARPIGACTQHACRSPTPLTVGGVDTGIDNCAGGGVRRRAIVDCPSLIPRPQECPVGDGASSTCTSDTDCTSAPNGYCEVGVDQNEEPGCHCLYGCLRDSDCESGLICVCREVVGVCFPALCSSGDSCLPGCDCVNIDDSTFLCQSPTDP